jgi:hypothetical protein
MQDSKGRHDIQHNDTQHNNKLNVTLRKMTVSMGKVR